MWYNNIEFPHPVNSLSFKANKVAYWEFTALQGTVTFTFIFYIDASIALIVFEINE